MNAAILACSSLTEYVQQAQRVCKTAYPVYFLDEQYHVEPEHMKRHMLQAQQALPAEVDTILVAMGFCGGVWDHVSFSRRVVIPRVDDCVSLLLQRGDEYIPNLKQPGHLYMTQKDPAKFCFSRFLFAQQESLAGLSGEQLFHLYFDGYQWLDIVDTGLTDCYSEAYVMQAQKNADLIGAALDYAEGGNRLLEKLVSGQWDEQFLVAEPGHLIRHADFF